MLWRRQNGHGGQAEIVLLFPKGHAAGTPWPMMENRPPRDSE